MAAVRLLLVVCVAALIGGCAGGGGSSVTGSLMPANAINTLAQAQVPGNWTILVYLNGDNDLESAALNNFNQMEMVGSTTDCKVIVQIDRAPLYDSSDDNWTDTRRYLVTYDSNADGINSLRLDSPALGELDMGNWQTLRDFVQWGVANFPADNYCVIVWDHGNGWQIMGATSYAPQVKYVSYDQSSGHVINVTRIPDALASASDTIDVLAFDACMMMQLEVAYELRNSASYMVGAPTIEPSPGYPYEKILARIGGSTTPEQLSIAIVEEYWNRYSSYTGLCYSAVDLSRIGAVADSATTLANALTPNAAAYSAQLKNAREATLDYSVYPGYPAEYAREFVEYAGRCSSIVGGSVTTAYNDVRNAVADAVIIERHSVALTTAKGLAIYLPQPSAINSNYSQLDFALSTTWDEWLAAQAQ